jgi:hypothetical protein
MVLAATAVWHSSCVWLFSMKPRIRLIIDHAEGHCTEVEIEGPKVTSAMLDAAEDLVQTLTTGERPVFKLLYDLTARAFNTTSEDAKVRITAATYGMSAPKIEEASAHKAEPPWNGEESEERKTLRQLATTQRYDGHPDLKGASGVLAYIIAAQPLVVTSLLEDLDAAEEKLRASHAPGGEKGGRGDDEFPRTAYDGPHGRSCYCPECK